MDIKNLKLFLAVYNAGNISAAATALGMNQPAVSKAIQRTELELGVTLFDREPRGVVPTIFADLLAETARDVNSSLAATMRRIGAMRDATEGEIVIGAGGTWQEAILPVAIARLTERRPKARIVIQPAPPEELIADLISGRFDLVLAPLDLPDDMARKVRLEPLIDNDLVVVARQGHRLANRATLTLQDLSAERWVLPQGKLIRERFERGFRAQGIEPPQPTIECFDSSCLFQIVEATELLTFVAEMRLRQRPNLKIVQLPRNSLNLSRVSGLILQRTSYVQPLAQMLIDEVRKLAALEMQGAFPLSP